MLILLFINYCLAQNITLSSTTAIASTTSTTLTATTISAIPLPTSTTIIRPIITSNIAKPTITATSNIQVATSTTIEAYFPTTTSPSAQNNDNPSGPRITTGVWVGIFIIVLILIGVIGGMMWWNIHKSTKKSLEKGPFFASSTIRSNSQRRPSGSSVGYTRRPSISTHSYVKQPSFSSDGYAEQYPYPENMVGDPMPSIYSPDSHVTVPSTAYYNANAYQQYGDGSTYQYGDSTAYQQHGDVYPTVNEYNPHEKQVMHPTLVVENQIEQAHSVEYVEPKSPSIDDLMDVYEVKSKFPTNARYSFFSETEIGTK